MNGMGMLHLEIKVHRMERDFRLKARVGKPRVSYREALKKSVRVVGECVRQAPGSAAGMFAKVTVEMEPYHGDEPVVVRSHLPADVIPMEFESAALSAMRGSLESGAALGYPMMNVRATLVGAEMDEALSNAVAFEMAGADAIRKGMDENIKLLEPWMRLVVTVPGDYGGAIVGDINSRRGEVHRYDMRSDSNVAEIEAYAPLANLFDYIDAVRSLSQGRASTSMEPHAYKEAPPDVLHRLLNPTDYY
jgi:elongation factor G